MCALGVIIESAHYKLVRIRCIVYETDAKQTKNGGALEVMRVHGSVKSLQKCWSRYEIGGNDKACQIIKYYVVIGV